MYRLSLYLTIALAVFLSSSLVNGDGVCTGYPKMYNGKPCASTTRYWDGQMGACGCGTGNTNPFSWQWNKPTAAASAPIFGSGTWCGSGCGKCFKLTPTAIGASPEGTGAPSLAPLVVKVSNLCPYQGNEAWCAYDVNSHGYEAHFDLMDYNMAGLISAAGWNNPEVTYEEVDCEANGYTDWNCQCADGATPAPTTSPSAPTTLAPTTTTTTKAPTTTTTTTKAPTTTTTTTTTQAPTTTTTTTKAPTTTTTTTTTTTKAPTTTTTTTTKAPVTTTTTTTQVPITTTTTEVPIIATEAPAPPTDAPTTTTTEAPAPPTDAPTTTKKPHKTKAPITTTTTEAPIAPTDAPTTTTEAPVTPTEAPVTTTEAPVTTTTTVAAQPSANSPAPVSAQVNGGSNSWWFGFSLDDNSLVSRITSIQVKDSGAGIPTWTRMSYEGNEYWNMYSIHPGTPMKLPLSLKFTLDDGQVLTSNSIITSFAQVTVNTGVSM